MNTNPEPATLTRIMKAKGLADLSTKTVSGSYAEEVHAYLLMAGAVRGGMAGDVLIDPYNKHLLTYYSPYNNTLKLYTQAIRTFYARLSHDIR